MKLNGTLEYNFQERLVIFKITDLQEPLTKYQIGEITQSFNGTCTLRTNAGLDIHTTEMKNGYWKGVKIERL